MVKMNKSGPSQKVKNMHDSRKKGWGKILKQKWKNYQWWLMLLGVIGVFILGYIGFSNIGKKLPPLDIFYRILQLFVLSFDTTITPNWALEVARWLAPTIAAYTAANALTKILSEQLQFLKILSLGDHIIICGLGNKGLLLSYKFVDSGYKVVVIELDKENDNIKECKNSGSIVLIGNATADYILRRAGLQKAKYLFCVCGDDGINIKIAGLSRKLLTKRSKRNKLLTCIVHIVDPKLSRLIKELEFETNKNDVFRLEFFNLFDQAAIALIDAFPPFNGNDEKEPKLSSPHLLIVGPGRLGESLVIHTAKKWMDLPGKTREKFDISIVDKTANQKKDLFYLRYPRLEQICKLIPLEMDINSQEFEGGHFLFNNNGECNLTMIYICLDNDSFALSTALTLHQRIRKHDIPIVVLMNSETGLADLIKGETHGLGRVNGFGLLDRVLNPELLLTGTHEILARAIHKEYCRDQSAKGKTLETNPSLVLWDELPETLKDSNRRQADYLGVKLGNIGCYIVPMMDWNADLVEFTTEEIERMAKMEHDHWMEERLKEGWRYAPGPKNSKKKRSPFLVPWEELPEDEKEKDRNPVRKMPGFLTKVGFQIYRKEKHE
jgi:hypothetical protein